MSEKKDKPVILEGFMKKSGSSKKDEIKDNFKERWFVLRGNTLYYYKHKGDAEAKGKMELEDAKIDPADSKTGKTSTFRLKQGQPKEIYTYFLCNSPADQSNWIKVLRKAAGGYDVEADEKKSAVQQQAICSYGVLLLVNGQAERVLFHVDIKHQYVQFFMEEKLHEEHPTHNIQTVGISKTPDLSLQQGDEIVDLYSVVVELKEIDKSSKSIVTGKRNIWCGNLAEVKEIEKLLKQLALGDYSTVRTLITKYPIRDRVKVKLGDSEGDHNYAPRHMILAEKRVLFFKKEDSKIPVWAILLSTAKIEQFDKTTLQITSGIESCLLKFENSEVMQNWLELFMETKQKYNIMSVEFTEVPAEKPKKGKK